jgi:S1-C subfamily serine protease
MGMIRHEFCRLVRAGARFPATIALDGGGTGFAVSASGHVLTNFHLVTAEVESQRREAGVLHQEVACRSLRAQVATKNAAGVWVWADAAQVWLVSNPPSSRAVVDDASGGAQLREDTALLRVAPPPSAYLELDTRQPALGETLWMAGFPLRSVRAEAARAAHRYADADGTLRVSSGVVTAVEPPDYFTTDIDGSMGNSGSPVFDAEGEVIGFFSRATGNGPRNAAEYGHMRRVHVTSALAVQRLALLPSERGG